MDGAPATPSRPPKQPKQQKPQTEGEGRPPKQQQQQQQSKGNKQQQAPSSGDASEGPAPARGQGASSSGGAPQQPRGDRGERQGGASASAGGSSTGGRAARLAMFDHLPRKKYLDMESIESDRTIHPAILKLGGLYRSGAVQDDDDRVCALFAAFCDVIKDYKTPPKRTLSWDLDKHIRLQVQHLVDCRQMSMSMGNFIKFVRFTITQVGADVSEADAKDFLLDRLYNFVEERISVAQQNIAKFCTSAIKANDVVLTFGSSPVIRQVLIAAAKVKTFKLIVVDARPLREGLKTVAALSPYVTCIYTPLACAATAMKEATKVILGASALLSNGSVFAPVGTAMVASLAKFLRVPVIFAAETYKFCEKVQLDSIVYNEIGSCSELVRRADAGEAASQPSSTSAGSSAGAPVPVMWTSYKGAAEVSELNSFPYEVINLRYDITPIQSVSVVATEAGMIPPTSVPVLIRELRLDQTGPAVTASIPGNQPTRK